ncbi:hypothetical protein EJB05_33762 [Eragrostis curvula]|uniref:Uncharacterized protein n=1 Tax=Eragrostis curvula TaxID=38414 RepID=A0A5J9U3N8_9POAL|nr:hypothetical protein EJB05_33762 [Eragrostis curvula]
MGGTILVTASSTRQVLPRSPRFEHGPLAVARAYANDRPLHMPSRERRHSTTDGRCESQCKDQRQRIVWGAPAALRNAFCRARAVPLPRRGLRLRRLDGGALRPLLRRPRLAVRHGGLGRRDEARPEPVSLRQLRRHLSDDYFSVHLRDGFNFLLVVRRSSTGDEQSAAAAAGTDRYLFLLIVARLDQPAAGLAVSVLWFDPP